MTNTAAVSALAHLPDLMLALAVDDDDDASSGGWLQHFASQPRLWRTTPMPAT
eukprot:CAMPEP_0185194632 /NCGR_PEP_ID=MMETSP1140-20130426/31610_1 /TAXON_ID=298111 /ORGANISM="Pavlova sp., Strain CCMP459" /LENGTH=52 /DNA_ID=CAMNT_0027761569 /DNA_START=46 /DNA_END=205 /DNA_ORIENTATION=+